MSKNTKITLIPLIGSVTFAFSYWITSVREQQSTFGISNDTVGGLAFGMGIGLSMVLLLALKKYRSSK